MTIYTENKLQILIQSIIIHECKSYGVVSIVFMMDWAINQGTVFGLGCLSLEMVIVKTKKCKQTSFA